MLEISQAIEYGVRGLMHLAQKEGDRPVHVKEIAQQEEISHPFLHKIFRRMSKRRILNSKRGVGFTLARAPEEITLLEVVEAIEGPIMIKECVVDADYCERTSQCGLTLFWTRLQEEMVARLRAVSVHDLVVMIPTQTEGEPQAVAFPEGPSTVDRQPSPDREAKRSSSGRSPRHPKTKKP